MAVQTSPDRAGVEPSGREAVQRFLECVLRSRLIERGVLSRAVDQFNALTERTPERRNEVRYVGKHLIDVGLLTSWQASLLKSGRFRGFFVGPYRLLSALGRGAICQVFLAEHTAMHRKVAIKLLPPEYVRDNASRERFRREARAVAALDHPNIVPAFGCGEEHGAHYLVLEYIAGQDLERLIQSEGPRPWRRAADYARQAATGLAHAHSKGLVHRDVKPSNLLVDEAGTVKLLDLGLARFLFEDTDPLTLQQRGAILGTIDYLAPEQALDAHHLDPRADLYSLGCTLYYLLTGQPPFAGGTLAEKLLKHQREEPLDVRVLRPEIAPAVAGVVQHLLAKSPRDRYSSALEVRKALTAAITFPNAPALEPVPPAPAESVILEPDHEADHDADHTPENAPYHPQDVAETAVGDAREGPAADTPTGRFRWGWVCLAASALLFLAGWMLRHG